MKNEQIIIMTEEKFKEIYTNEELRNAVAFAHGVCLNSEGKGTDYMKALMYPISYRVTEEQIIIATGLRNKRAKEVLKDYKNKLLFVGMGMDFQPKIMDGIGNFRIRTAFLNSKGEKCFIELGTGRDPEFLRIDHAITNYGEDSREHKNNHNRLEHGGTPALKYTYQNVLALVNEHFGCNFKDIVVDGYNIGCNGIICESPEVVNMRLCPYCKSEVSMLPLSDLDYCSECEIIVEGETEEEIE